MYLEKAKKMFDWDSNPFSFKILPDLFVGYEKEVDRISAGIENGSKFTLLLGPTGSGKTTMMKHLVDKFDGHYKYIIYMAKPPRKPDDWVDIFSNFTKKGFLSSFFSRSDTNIYNLADNMNRKLGSEKILLFVDESHEASVESFEWLRALTDQIDDLYIVMAGLPVFEGMMKTKLESLMRRVSTRIELTNLTKSETRELIKKRIESIGGDDIKPFTGDSIDFIYRKTAGFPREILRTCSEFVQMAMEKNISTVDNDFLKETDEPQSRVSLESLDSIPERQRKILEVLSKGEMTPSKIISNLESIDEYKNRDNALRSVNNLLGRLRKDGLVERKRVGKTYKYQIAGKYQTMLVET